MLNSKQNIAPTQELVSICIDSLFLNVNILNLLFRSSIIKARSSFNDGIYI